MQLQLELKPIANFDIRIFGNTTSIRIVSGYSLGHAELRAGHALHLMESLL